MPQAGPKAVQQPGLRGRYCKTSRTNVYLVAQAAQARNWWPNDLIRRTDMRSLVKRFPRIVDRTPLSLLIFLVVWFVGTGALNAGLQGLGKNGVAIGLFAAACASWYGALKLGGTKIGAVRTAGFLVIGLWAIKLCFALLINFHYCVTDPFFWVSVGLLFLLSIRSILS
jgi:hypothetical protein